MSRVETKQKLAAALVQEMPIGTMEGGKKMCLSWSADMFWCSSVPGTRPEVLEFVALLGCRQIPGRELADSG